MSRMRVSQRWLALPWGVFGVVLAIIFGGIAAYSWLHPEDGPSVRMALPLYAVAVYLVLVCLFNIRTAVITPRQIREFVWPLPARLPRWTRRDDVRHCYLREVETYSEGTVLETYYMAGVETLAGRQIDVSTPHKTAEEAVRVATEIARVLNEEPAGRRIEVREVEQRATRAEMIRRVLLGLFWLVVCIAAILLGAAWETQHQISRKTAVPTMERIK